MNRSSRVPWANGPKKLGRPLAEFLVTRSGTVKVTLSTSPGTSSITSVPFWMPSLNSGSFLELTAGQIATVNQDFYFALVAHVGYRLVRRK